MGGRCPSGFGPPGPNPPADMDPRGFGPPGSISASGYGLPSADLDPFNKTE